MNEELVRVTLIKIKLGVKELELTPDEARLLRNTLDELLGPNPAQPVFVPQPIIYPHQPFTTPPGFGDPIWINPNVDPWPNRWVVTCGPVGQSATLNINT